MSKVLTHLGAIQKGLLEHLLQPVETLGLLPHAASWLANARYELLGQIAEKTEAELLESLDKRDVAGPNKQWIPTFVEEVNTALAKAGLSLGMKFSKELKVSLCIPLRGDEPSER